MRSLGIVRLRLLTITRAATPIFILAAFPALVNLLFLSTPEPFFRAWETLALDGYARAALSGWFFHILFLAFAMLLTGKVKTPHDDVVIAVIPDLMDTAPIKPGERFWGETFGTFAAALAIHVCSLPLLAALVALNPLPTSAFVWIEAAAIALLFLACAGAAWQRRAPRTKFSGTRGPRNAALVATLFIFALAGTTRWQTFRDSLATFIVPRTSMRAWSEVMAAVEKPLLLAVLLVLLYAGTIAYYYVTSTRKRVWES